MSDKLMNNGVVVQSKVAHRRTRRRSQPDPRHQVLYWDDIILWQFVGAKRDFSYLSLPGASVWRGR